MGFLNSLVPDLPKLLNISLVNKVVATKSRKSYKQHPQTILVRLDGASGYVKVPQNSPSIQKVVALPIEMESVICIAI